MTAPTTNSQSILIGRTAGEVFDFMADATRLDLWSFGTWSVILHKDGLIEGRSIFDGTTTFLRIHPRRDDLLIDYALGSEPAGLRRRISAGIAAVDGESAELTLTAERDEAMRDSRWERLITAHAFELKLIKSLLETGYDHRKERGYRADAEVPAEAPSR